MIYIVIWLLCGVLAATIYSRKGRSGAAAFIVGLLLGPIGVLLAAISSTDGAALEQKQLATGQLKKCPHCGEMIRPEATVCRFCHRDLALLAVPVAGTVARIVANPSGGYLCSLCSASVTQATKTCPQCKKPLFVSASVYAGLK